MGKTGKKIISAVIACLLFLQPLTLRAAVVDNGAVYKVATNQMKGWPAGPELVSETAVLMDADTGVILYNKGMDEKRYPASITKIMTALLALEKGSPEDSVTFTEECLADQTWDSTNAGMHVGEILTLRQCLTIMLLVSANDVATQIAVHISGSVAAFAEEMNRRAEELGCANTHFVNASGMPDDDQYTSAHDMALIFREAIGNETFREIIGTQSFTLEPTNMNGETRTFRTHQETIVTGSQFYYEGCFGGKTGGSTASKNTLVNGASRDGMTLIAVTMRADIMSAWNDHKKLLDYGFENFRRKETEGGSVTLPKDRKLSDLKLTEEEKDGKIAVTYYYGEDYYLGNALKEKPVETKQPQASQAAAVEETPETSVSTEHTPQSELLRTYRLIICGLGGLILLSLLLLIITLIRRRHW